MSCVTSAVFNLHFGFHLTRGFNVRCWGRKQTFPRFTPRSAFGPWPCENSKNGRTTRIIFRNQSKANKRAKFRRPETTLGGMLIPRNRSAAAFCTAKTRSGHGTLGTVQGHSRRKVSLVPRGARLSVARRPGRSGIAVVHLVRNVLIRLVGEQQGRADADRRADTDVEGDRERGMICREQPGGDERRWSACNDRG